VQAGSLAGGDASAAHYEARPAGKVQVYGELHVAARFPSSLVVSQVVVSQVVVSQSLTPLPGFRAS
jgi:hypothetical protein